jgi:hypothetical protein
MIYEIPITSTAQSFVQETELGGITYRFLFRWNTREEEWYLTLSSVEDVIALSSIKLVSGAAFFRHCSNRNVRPNGELLLVGTATRTNLGTAEARLFFCDAEEFA